MRNWIYGAPYYSCDLCFAKATVHTEQADHCQQCADTWAPFNSDAYFARLDAMERMA